MDNDIPFYYKLQSMYISTPTLLVNIITNYLFNEMSPNKLHYHLIVALKTFLFHADISDLVSECGFQI